MFIEIYHAGVSQNVLPFNLVELFHSYVDTAVCD